MGLPFQPESDEDLRKRFPQALSPVYDIAEIAAARVLRPGQQRKHVFDFKDGIRGIVSIEKDGEIPPMLHVSFSGMPIPGEAESPKMAAAVALLHERAKKLSGARLAYAQVEHTDVAVHSFIRQNR